MRCRKVRSYLSAYCRDELFGRQQASVSEHLSTCTDCRKEEVEYQSMQAATLELKPMSVAKGFYDALLNRVAQERFAETRTKAYLPSKAPRLRWATVVPAFVSAAAVVLVAVMLFQSMPAEISPTLADFRQTIDDDYLTVQPNADRDWSLTSEMAKAERFDQISRRIMNQAQLLSLPNSYGLTNVSSRSTAPAPYFSPQYRVRPVVRVYQLPQKTAGREVNRTY